MSDARDPNGPLKIAYLTYRGKPHVGGQGVYTRHLTKALVDLGHSVEVFGGQPYPVLDDRIKLNKLPSLDLINDHYPFRFPAIWELKTREDFYELGLFLTGTFGEPAAFSARVKRHLAQRTGEFDLVHDNQCLGYGILSLEKLIPTIVTLHHPITRDRALEMEHAPNWYKKFGVSRFYSFVEMQGRVASRMPRIVVVSENSITDINKDMGVSRDRMRLVPVGVDPKLFKPQPHIARQSGRLITTASADVALKGLSYLLEAMAVLRKDRDIRLTIIGKPRPGHSMDLIDSLGLRPHIDFVSETIPGHIAIATMITWRWVGYNALIFLAAMLAISGLVSCRTKPFSIMNDAKVLKRPSLIAAAGTLCKRNCHQMLCI